MVSCLKVWLVSVSTFLAFAVCLPSFAQSSHSEQVQIKPPLIRSIDPPAQDATVADLEKRGDELRTEKMYLDALDYYRAAMGKEKNSSRLFNKVGIAELMMQRYREARKSFEQSIRFDHKYADAYNNLGVVYYEEKKYSTAVKQYRKAVAIDESSASFYSNLDGDRSGCVRAQFARRSAGTTAEPRRPRALRLHRREALRQDGLLGPVAGIFAKGEGRGIQRFQERLQGRRIRATAQGQAIH